MPINKQHLNSKMHLNRNNNFEKNILEECLLISKAYMHLKLVLKVLVQELKDH